MKINQLKDLFTNLKGSGKVLRYGDLMKHGFSRVHIDHAADVVGINYCEDKDGYTILVF